ncbi:MAG: asparagine synthase (glutamine-hydrolyzing) [Rhodospirillaceae bacterium]|jgi:asparagine synthase (glutamine-hydrolysing)|nr:asparagine synthase (glutamine-hydrolyzing) [Rhodospirillaceae bacterium]MBT6136070.1 asparagine synthase (glutamine-hydrolyzing) [Rhodospirillaceae bacterium]
MCGIAGYYGTREIPASRLDEAVRSLQRRGPDDSAWNEIETGTGRKLYFVYSRLAILDLDPRSNQPFRHGSIEMIYNGELYNYIELREQLRGSGQVFRTEGDTEVFAAQATQHGTDGLDAGEGMWAAAWYDHAAKQLVLTRDRFGEKPLYIHQDETGIYFASEVKQLFALMGRKLPIDGQQVRRYLVNGYKSLYKKRGGGTSTFFEGLDELPAAGYATIDRNGERSTDLYWQPTVAETDDDMTYEQAVAGARERLIRSMELRLRADVPVAFCLSGGIDSNALIAIAKRHLGYDVHGFTIMNTDARYEEGDMVMAAVNELDLRHTPIPVDTSGFLPGMRELVRYHDAPVFTITYFAQWRLMEAVNKAGYKVSVSGTAADELFSGYYDHHNAYLRQVSNDPALHAEALENWNREIKPIVRNPFLGNPDYFIETPEARDHIYLNADEFASYLTANWHEGFGETGYSDDLLRNRMANELFEEAVPVILHEDDLNAMYYSIENRSPFLDKPLFEWCQRIPTRHLVQNGRAKAVLRDAARGLAPDAVMDNPRKVGFNAPIFDYLDPKDPAVRSELLDDSPIFDVLRRDRIADMLERDELANSASKFLFNFVSTKLFLEEFAS